jgi:antitoxin component of MazEF toxin-antitoxin module
VTRKVVKTGSSLAVTLPRDVVQEFRLKDGDDVEVTVHPRTGAIVIRPGAAEFERGRVTPRFKDAARRVLERYDHAFDKLSK